MTYSTIIHTSGNNGVTTFQKPTIGEALDLYFPASGMFADADCEHPLSRSDAEAALNDPHTGRSVQFWNEDGDRFAITAVSPPPAAPPAPAVPYQHEFPAWSPDQMPAIPTTWKDVSWHNDAMPCFEVGTFPLGGVAVVVWVDHADPAQSDFPEGRADGTTPRYHVQRRTEDGGNSVDVFGSDDWGQVVRFAQIEAVAAEFAAQLSEDMSDEEWAKMRADNWAQTSDGICHSHDHLDANMTMLDAFAKVLGRDLLPDNDQSLTDANMAVANAAWTVAADHYLKAEPGSEAAMLDQWRTTRRHVEWLSDHEEEIGTFEHGGGGWIYGPGFIEDGTDEGAPFMVNVSNISATFPTLGGAERMLWDCHSKVEWEFSQNKPQAAPSASPFVPVIPRENRFRMALQAARASLVRDGQHLAADAIAAILEQAGTECFEPICPALTDLISVIIDG